MTRGTFRRERTPPPPPLRRITKFFLMKKFVVLSLLALTASFASAEDVKPLKVLMVTGGCCHDYEMQKMILQAGISARANVEFTVVHEEGPEGKKDRTHRISIYEKDDWARGYDVVLHNERGYDL